MEWIIMNCDDIKSLCGNIGVVIDGTYQTTDDCIDTLQSLLESLQDEDPVDRNARRQLAASHIIQQDLVPMLVNIEDDPEVFHLGVRLLVNMTQPVECLQLSESGENNGQQGAPPWVWDVSAMLMEAKTACSNVKFSRALFSEIQKIYDDAGEYDLVESDCESINQCLLLIRNLLYIQDSTAQRQDCIADIQLLFLKNLFQCGIDKVLLFLLNARQKDFWGVTLVQLISLLYRDLVSEIFMRIEDFSSCGEESCDSSNCSHCEAAMDRSFPFQPSLSSKMKKQSSIDSSGKASPDFTQKTASCTTETKTLEHGGSECSSSSSPLLRCFSHSCHIGPEASDDTRKNDDSSTKSCDQCNKVEKPNRVEQKDYSTSSTTTLKRDLEKSKQDSIYSDDKSIDSSSSLDELGSQLTEFTFNFLQNGFTSLVNVLKGSLMGAGHGGSHQMLDESYFLWSVAFFLKFARRKEIEFKKIKEVFTPEVFGFIVFEAVSNGEDVIVSYKNNRTYALSMRRLHLSVSALRELIKTLSFHRERGLEEEDDIEYLEQLQRNLANMTDLRQLFLWLVRMYQPGCHSILFLRDVIVTNHYFLLLLEEWIGRHLCNDNRIDMLVHVKQFAVQSVMQRYGYLLQNFVRNDHHVNNCIFTMMHHVAGDCLKPEALLQADILKTFLQIWDLELPITQEMNDLMEYIIQQFLSTAEENPLSCALKVFMDPPDTVEDMFIDGTEGNDEWSEEEIDKIYMQYAELEGCPDMVDRMKIMFGEIGIKKSKLEIVNHMVKMGWMDSDQMTLFIDSDKQVIDVESPQLLIEDEKQKKIISILEKLSVMEEEKIIPHCVKILREDGFDSQLRFVQDSLLEAAYIKIDGQYMDKRHIEEPSFKYFYSKGKDMPIIFYTEDQEKIEQNVYMLALMQQMGLRLEDETGLVYPRIPSSMTVMDLVELAKMLGKIDPEHVKFNIDMTSELISEKTEVVSEKPGKVSPFRSSKPAVKVPGIAWMNLVAKFNMAEESAKVNRRISLDMDTQ